MLLGSPEVEVCDGGSLSGFTGGKLAIPVILLAIHKQWNDNLPLRCSFKKIVDCDDDGCSTSSSVLLVSQAVNIEVGDRV